MASSPEQTLEHWLREASAVLAFCGAGVSAESGVPTFRGAGGLWEGHRVADVATPEAFEQDPRTVWRFYAARQEALQQVEPNPAHAVLAAMEERTRSLLVTQNVDNLHERAGSRKLIKLHGSLMEVLCTRCETITPLREPVSVAGIEAGELPHCECGGLLRPNVVWFGEALNPLHFEQIDRFFRRCPAPLAAARPALLLIIGTSGTVSGGYGITPLAQRFGARVVEINPEASAFSASVDLAVREPAGALLGRVWARVCN